MKTIYLGAGCFWCSQAVYERLKGVDSEVGYIGTNENASYESVCAGDGSVEVVRLDFDEKQTSLEKILEIFLKIHDPTSFNKQGADIGVQYASGIFYEDEKDFEFIKDFLKKAQKDFEKAFTTRVEKLEKPLIYTRAEEYHQHFFDKNPTQGYCLATIPPKLKKAGLI